ncbi:MAG: flagellar hook-length control protein FliK [Porticoccus sp.]|nr:flagellar hook-length control protein FliK [Porticoccus sp.]
MEELQLALTATRVEQKNFGLWLKSWQVGQVLQALVTDKFPSGQLVLRVAGQQITATADIPVQKGAVLMLEVSRLTPTPTLKIIHAPVAAGVSVSALRGELQLLLPQFLPQQGRVLDPFLTLFSPAQGANILAFLGLKRADIERLFKQVHRVDQLVDPKLLKVAVERSGLFLESQLQQLVSAGGLLPPGDLKAELLRLLNRVNRKLKHPSGIDHETLGLLNKLKQELDGAIAKITLHQLEASQSDSSGQTVWSFEIPIRFKESVAYLSLSVTRDNDPSDKPKPQDQQDWKAVLSVTAPKLGLVEAELFLRGQKVSVVIFSSENKTVQLINNQIDQLRVGLESRGLDVSVLLSREGELKPKQNKASSSGCVDERI